METIFVLKIFSQVWRWTALWIKRKQWWEGSFRIDYTDWFLCLLMKHWLQNSIFFVGHMKGFSSVLSLTIMLFYLNYAS